MSIRPRFNRWQAYGLAGSIVVIVLATVLHNPFGGYVRDDGLYSKIEFLRMFRESFLEYADLSDEDLLAKVVAKYPAFKTWIREDTDGSPPMPVAISGQPANYRLRPPPAYYSARMRCFCGSTSRPSMQDLSDRSFSRPPFGFGFFATGRVAPRNRPVQPSSASRRPSGLPRAVGHKRML